MRVIGGRYGGRILTAPKGRDTRPTSDRVREALFAILDPVSDARVLDLYAGSGALAIEALSRGAAEATLVESSATAMAAIERNLNSLGLNGELRRQTARAFLERARVDARQYDLVFLDPPYRQAGELSEELSRLLAPILAPGARIVAESDRRVPLTLELSLLDERRYGDTLIRIYAP